MGIKGLNDELRSCGEVQAFAKLALDHLEKTGKPLRIAVDIAIWMFQLRSAQGGFSPELRTLFYRLTRLRSLAIEPIFVFDGPNKPKIKRNKNSTRSETASAATAQAKRIIRMFGLLTHDAPGEAEAECALLQQRGIVDAVFSEDVDTIMFGCTHTLRFARNQKPSGPPMHVVSHRADRIRRDQQLDREGMVLIAMMSGGDYDPDGVENCGVKVASEAARAGFGKSLCALKAADAEGIRAWREKLQHELATNESRFFRQKHKALKIPDSFPNMEILRYYTHPVVSPPRTVDRLAQLPDSDWAKPIYIDEMRRLTEEFFDWSFKGGALKLIRVLSPCILVQKLLALSRDPENDNLSIEEKQKREGELIKKIKSRRRHESTDHLPELRIEYIPLDITGIDISQEREAEIITTRDGLATNSDEEFLADAAAAAGDRPAKVYDPSVGTLGWVPELLVRLGAPLAVEDFEETLHKKEDKARATATKRARSARSVTPQVQSQLQFAAATKQPTDTASSTQPASPRKARHQSQPPVEILSSPAMPRRAAEKSFKRSVSSISAFKTTHASAAKPLNPWAAAGATNALRTTKTAHGPPPEKAKPIRNTGPPSPEPPRASIEPLDDIVRLDIPELPPTPKFSSYKSQPRTLSRTVSQPSPQTVDHFAPRPQTPDAASQVPILIDSSPEPVVIPPRHQRSQLAALREPALGTQSKIHSTMGPTTKRDSNSLSLPDKSPIKTLNAPAKKRAFQPPPSRHRQTSLELFLSSSPPRPSAKENINPVSSSPPLCPRESSRPAGSAPRQHLKENVKPVHLGSHVDTIVLLSDDDDEDSFLALDQIPKASLLREQR
ncbi:hypothetical protein BROUX41_006756 [Berkeleyomyces rouxiae]